MLAGANIIYGLGMLEMGMTISYSQLLMDAEMAEMMLYSMDGIVVNDETLSVDVIKEVGPRGDFLSHMNTFENMHIQSKPKLIDRLTRDRWKEAGSLDMEARAGSGQKAACRMAAGTAVGRGPQACACRHQCGGAGLRRAGKHPVMRCGGRRQGRRPHERTACGGNDPFLFGMIRRGGCKAAPLCVHR